MRPRRWIPFSELHEASYEPIEGIFDALYTLAPRLHLSIVSTPVEEAREWVAVHDARYRDTCFGLQDILSQIVPPLPRVTFYQRVLHASPLEDMLHFASSAPLGIRISRFSVLKAIPAYLREHPH